MNQSNTPGIAIPHILIPGKGVNLSKWAVIACDQFTSQPEYWERVKQIVGESPSTYHMILPEVYLGTSDETSQIQRINRTMESTLASGILIHHDGPIYIERTYNGKTRKGLMLCLDLEEYDYNKGSQTLIRATEGTILERLPPRIRIREHAPMEIPHIIALIDDPKGKVIEPLAANKQRMPVLYDFDLMEDSGHLTGYSVADERLQHSITEALQNLTDRRSFQEKYSTSPDKKVLLVAIGDGNHSLATAKAIWNNIKAQVGMDHPARYALVEIENIHDKAIEFEPIHRVLFNLKDDLLQAFSRYYEGRVSIKQTGSSQEMIDETVQLEPQDQKIGVIFSGGFYVARISDPPSNIAVGSLQIFLDDFIKHGGAGRIDYVHGEDVLLDLGHQQNNAGFYLPPVKKHDLFKTVIVDGVLPRKTFSMGSAKAKRFYLECRKIV